LGQGFALRLAYGFVWAGFQGKVGFVRKGFWLVRVGWSNRFRVAKAFLGSGQVSKVSAVWLVKALVSREVLNRRHV
ncbi:MAG: hypothetical protein AB1457_18835, partial [Chloroflexota bacterium]